MQFIKLGPTERIHVYAAAAEILRFYIANNMDMEKTISRFKATAETAQEKIFSNSTAKQKLKAELDHFVNLFNVQSLPESMTVSDIKGQIVEHMHTVATIINDEMDDETFGKLLKAWPVQTVGFEFGGWIDLKSSNNNRQRVRESVIVNGQEIMIDPSVKKTGFQTQPGTEVSNIFSDLLGYVLFVYGAWTSFASNVFAYQEDMVAVVYNAAVTPNKNFRTLQVQARNYRTLLNGAGIFDALKIKAIESNLNSIQRRLEIIETLPEYKSADGSAYNFGAIEAELLNPLKKEIAENHWSFDDHTMAVFQTLGLLENQMHVEEHLQTKYLHAVSLAAQVITENGVSEPEVIERIQSEWPKDVLVAAAAKKGSVYTI